uniref:melanoma antigen recognized by T-cells 1 n=1 Tax=Monopterus albus TaxID=43700 RepID=UPI0009B397D8|nr:melanoma antigen recognized by T-cells 1 [Monopterus albus]
MQIPHHKSELSPWLIPLTVPSGRLICLARQKHSGRYLKNEITELRGPSVFWEDILTRRTVLCNRLPNSVCLMRCNHTDGMPRGDFNIYFANRGGGFVRAEEAVGITLLVIILAALLILGCWYFKKRGGYKIIRNPRAGSPGSTGGHYSEACAKTAENKMALTDFGRFRSVVPNAPPAYEKISAGPLPPPYSP